MQHFIDKYRDQINGVLSGFDRLVFRGSLRGLNYGYWDPHLQAAVALGMEQYLWHNQILFKDYADHVKRVSQEVKQQSVKIFEQQGRPVLSLRDSGADKDQIARQIAEKEGVDQGLVCAISTVEASLSLEHRVTHMVRRVRPCQVVYHYQIDATVGWMYARLQTWFPFHIQVGMNGREWLARQMDREGLKYRQQGNCFVWIEDYRRAQQLLEQQLQTNWTELLERFARQLNPQHQKIFARIQPAITGRVFSPSGRPTWCFASQRS